MLDVDAAVYGPGGETHYSVQRQKSGSFQVMAPSAGFYKFCLSNKMSTITDKTVAFTLHTGDDLFKDIAKQGAWRCAARRRDRFRSSDPPPPHPPEHITPLETEITQLTDGIAKIEDEQQYMWARERQTQTTNASTNSRVLWFSVAETTVLIGLGVWQIITLRSFFERKRGV